MIYLSIAFIPVLAFLLGKDIATSGSGWEWLLCIALAINIVAVVLHVSLQ